MRPTAFTIEEIHREQLEAARTMLDACKRCVSLLETVEAKALVGDEGCLWPVELMRAAIAAAETAGITPAED